MSNQPSYLTSELYFLQNSHSCILSITRIILRATLTHQIYLQQRMNLKTEYHKEIKSNKKGASEVFPDSLLCTKGLGYFTYLRGKCSNSHSRLVARPPGQWFLTFQQTLFFISILLLGSLFEETLSDLYLSNKYLSYFLILFKDQEVTISVSDQHVITDITTLS